MTHEEFVTQLAKSLRADGFSCWVSENCCTVEVSWATTSDAGKILDRVTGDAPRLRALIEKEVQEARRVAETRRYYVDRRGGCAAVRDRTIPCDSPGLHPGLPGVIQYWGGSPVNKACQTCGHASFTGWEVPEESLLAAEALCRQLNDSVKTG